MVNNVPNRMTFPLHQLLLLLLLLLTSMCSLSPHTAESEIGTDINRPLSADMLLEALQ